MPELTDQSTHEDIQAAVDEIIDSRSDAEKLAADRDKPTGDMTAEEDSGSQETAPEEEKTGDSEDRDWLDDNLKAEVSAYGIDEKDLADFTSREEVDRALRFFDRRALEAGRKAMAEGDEKTKTRTRGEDGRYQKEEEPEPKEYEISLDKNIYDEGLVAELTRMRDHYEARVAAIEGRFAEADARAEEQRFDSLVDTLGHADLFGKSGKESPKELQRRQDLFVAVKAQQIGLAQLGRPVDLDESLLNRVARMVFADELAKKDLKNRTRKLSKQSDSRMGGSATKTPGPPEPLRDEMRRLYKQLEEAG